MHKLTIIDERGKVLDEIEIKHKLQRFIIHRGRLLELVVGTSNKYKEQSYLELY